jgi:phosphotransferase system HPr (HPr) family protein
MKIERAENPIDETHSREVVVANEQGLHARPADLVAREAQRWESRIEFIGKAQRVDGKSILDLLTLAAEEGTHLVIEATGPDACEALDAIGNLFDKKFASNDSKVMTHSEKTQQEKHGSGTPARINTVACEGVADGNTNS